MGLRSGAKLGKIHSVRAGGCWVRDGETDDGWLLRPDWKSGWKENSVWHDDLLVHVRTKAPELNPLITKEMMEGKDDSEILARIQTVFKNFKNKYRTAQKGMEDSDQEQGEDDTEEQRTKRNRHKARKERVSRYLMQSLQCQCQRCLDRNVMSGLLYAP